MRITVKRVNYGYNCLHSLFAKMLVFIAIEQYIKFASFHVFHSTFEKWGEIFTILFTFINNEDINVWICSSYLEVKSLKFVHAVCFTPLTFPQLPIVCLILSTSPVHDGYLGLINVLDPVMLIITFLLHTSTDEKFTQALHEIIF